MEGLGRAFDSLLGTASESEVRQIVLTDAHSVVEWRKWCEIEERHWQTVVATPDRTEALQFLCVR